MPNKIIRKLSNSILSLEILPFGFFDQFLILVSIQNFILLIEHKKDIRRSSSVFLKKQESKKSFMVRIALN